MIVHMTKSNHPDLTRAEALLDDCQFREALAIVNQVEKEELSPEDYLYCRWLKMNIRGHQGASEDLIKISTWVYQESKAQSNPPVQFEALFWQAVALFIFRPFIETIQQLEQIILIHVP